MSERPIIFSAPMVRAILDGSKTQTRRVIKDLKGYENTGYDFCVGMNNGELQALTAGDHGWEATGVRCPYGQPGDRLWVRETWQSDPCAGEIYPGVQIPSDAVCYGADCTPEEFIGAKPWRPSIHMPRWASRITLEIAGIRVERLQDISEADARAEGVEETSHYANLVACNPKRSCNHTCAFADLWETINGAESWAANPWVWVVEFKRVGT